MPRLIKPVVKPGVKLRPRLRKELLFLQLKEKDGRTATCTRRGKRARAMQFHISLILENGQLQCTGIVMEKIVKK